MRTKLHWMIHHLGFLLAAACLAALSGCGGGGSSANVITVTVSPSASSVIVGTTVTFTAIEGGVTTQMVTWTCTYTTTTTTGTTTKTNPAKSCDSALPSGAVGKISNPQPTTVVYNAPTSVPDPTMFQGLIVIITATATADTKKTGTAMLALDSGIAISFTPRTATVPLKEQQLFRISLTNDTAGKGVTWLVTQTAPTSTNPATPIPMLPSCSPDCGTIDKMTGLYTAPATLPTSTKVTTTPTVVTVVATANADTSRFATGTITIVAGGQITFNFISPNFAPQGAQFWDIYLAASNISSSSTITVTDPTGTPKTFNSTENTSQVKILFPIPTAAVTAPSSSGARLRLTANSSPPDLVLPGTYTISVSDSGETVTAPNLQMHPAFYQFTVVPVRATSVASKPDGFNLGALATSGLGGQSATQVDGGYFGPGGEFVNLFFGGNQVPATGSQTDARHLTANFNDSTVLSLSPGLYPLSMGRTKLPFPVPNNPAVTNLALFPDYSGTNNKGALITTPVAAGMNPSAIDIDTKLGVVVVAETVSNAIQFFRIASSSAGGIISDSLVPIDGVSGHDCGQSCPVTGVGAISMNLPTGVSVNSTNHTVAVVNYGSQMTDSTGKQIITGQNVMAFPIPVPGATQQNPAITPFAIDISNILQGSVVPVAPMPYAIGVDPDTNLALVAYSSISTSSPANVGFVLNLNPNTAGSNTFGCPTTILPLPPSPSIGQCVYSQVTLNTGVYPQIAMAPHGHLAIVTPGGSGVVQGVDVTQKSKSVTIANIMIAAGVVTVATTGPHNLVPGNAGSVLIAGVPLPGSMGNSTPVNFNGVFPVAVDSATTFSYSVTNTTVNATVPPVAPATTEGTVYFGLPNLDFPGSSTTQGIAINPITRTAALADANSTGQNGPQIDLLSGLDQSTSSITFFAGCTAFSNPTTNPCANAPEFLGTTNVAWQPFTNSVVSYNPVQKQVSISDATQRRRNAIVPNPLLEPALSLGPGAISIPVMNGSTDPTTRFLTLWGGIAVDPATNYAFVVESGRGSGTGTNPPPATNGQIELINLAPTSPTIIKPVNITEILVPTPVPGLGSLGGVPHATLPQGTLSCIPTPPAAASSCDLANVQIFGSGFGSSSGPAPQVLLDGTAIPSTSVTVVNDRQLLATIPGVPYLAMPHKFALQVVSNGVASNAADFFVIRAVDLTSVCSGGKPSPSGVAVADQIAQGPFSPIAVVTNSGCNNIAIIDINPANATSTFGTVINNTPVGTNPQGVAISQRFGFALVANTGDGTASVIDLTTGHIGSALTSAVQTGSNAQPMGVAINEATGAALIANFGANTVSEVDLSLLRGATPAKTLTASTVSGIQQPIAVAIDPDRGPSNQGIAVVTALELISGSSPVGALAVVDIGQATPALSTTIPSGSISATPTGVVFDPTVFTGTANNGVFYASTSGGNQISIFNPDTGGGSAVSVGINPTALAYNPQTGALLTTNLGSNTVSIVDMLANPLKTRQTLGLPGSAQFGVAIDQFTNLAVIVDQANNRLLLFPMPN